MDAPIWHPHAERVQNGAQSSSNVTVDGFRIPASMLPSKRRRRQDPAKCTIHSTETGPGTARSVAARLKTPYNLIADIETQELLALLPLNFTSWGLRGTHVRTGAKIETNHSGVNHPQIAICGVTADRMHLLDDGQLRWLADVVFGPTLDLCGIVNQWWATFGEMDRVVPYLATPESPIRLTVNQFHAAAGVLSHQGVPGNDHWDPGKLNVVKLKRMVAGGGASPPVPPPDDPVLRALELAERGILAARQAYEQQGRG